MYGTSEDRRFMGPAGSQTHTHHNSPLTATNLQNLSTHQTIAAAAAVAAAAAAAPYPTFFPPLTHFQHLAALHTSLTANTINTDLILNQTNAHTPNLWPTSNPQLSHTSANAVNSERLTPFDFHVNGQVTDSLFAARNLNTPPVSGPYLPVTSLNFVAKNFQGTAAATQQFSQAKSLLLQSQTDYFGNTFSTTKKSETCYSRWQTGQQHQPQSAFEPLHIQVPPHTNISIKSESIGSNSSLLSHQRKPNSINCHNSDIECNELTQIVTEAPTTSTTTIIKKSALELERQTEHSLNLSADSSKHLSVTSTLSRLPLANTTERSTSSVANTQSQTKTTSASHSVHDITSGCSRTVPLFWNNLNASNSLLQIKREPCQVSEITTSNSIQSGIAGIQQQRRSGSDHTTPIIKIEAKSPTETTPPVINSITSSIVNMDQHSSNQVQSGAIPVGIAVARQRFQEHTVQQQHQHQPKDINRFGNIGITSDLGGATSAFTQQNMLYTGPNQTMIPFNSDVATGAVSMGISGAVQGAVRTPPTLWQYPAPVPMESMLPHVPFQLLRDPNSGQFLFFPTAATSIEPFQHHQQQAVVWPTTYTQPQTAIQAAPHLLMPPIAAAQTMQAPSLTPLLLGAPDYLSASTTLHQHTQTHSTRLVALSSDNNNKRKNNVQNSNMPLSMSSHPTLIKIEDAMSTGTGTQCNSITPYEPKSQAVQTATITAAVQTNDVGTDIAAQLNNYYQAHGLHGNLIQIAPHTSSVPPTQSLACSTSNPTITASIPFLNAFDYRHMQSQTMPNILTPPDVTISTMSCLTPISETYSRSEENFDSSGVSTLPEVQDATIQTDTPIMSEDDNTNGADDSAYSSNIIVNSNSDGLNISIPTTTSCSDICHSISNLSETSVGTSPPISPNLYAVSCRVSAYSNDMIHSSSSNEANVDDHGLNRSNDISTSSELNKSNECSFETAVSSTNMIEDEHLPSQPTPESETSSPLSLITGASKSPHELVNSSNIIIESVESAHEKPSVRSSGLDLSGLELLSNSIEAFEKRPFIKQEPIERMPELSPAYSPKNTVNATEEPRRLSIEQFEALPRYEDHDMAGKSLQLNPTFVPVDEQLGGLNLLCALAEQHFQEEVGNEQRAERKRSMSSSDGSETKRAKKHKEKKAKKKERKEKERKERHNSSGSNGISSTEDAIENDFKETFDRIKEKYPACDCRKTASTESCCCKMKWPTPLEVYVAMKSEMRHQLVEIKRKVKEEERKLESINSKESRLQRESTPSSSKSSGSSSKLSLGSMPSAFSPSILSSSSLEQGNVELSSNGKIHSDTESCSSTSSKPKLATAGDNNIEFQTMKNKSLVGYIFASKKRINDSRFDSTADETSLNSDISAKLKRNVNAVKQEVYDFDESVAHPEMKLFGNFHEKHRSKNHLSSVIGEGGKLHKLKPSSLTRHVKKLKSEKEHKHHDKELERKRNINAKCVLTAPHLDTLTENKMLRVLTAMGGLFYAGCLTAIRAPDLYGVTLDGERGNKAHIMSREEILRDAILEVAPNSTANIPPGTRICAYWSQQYRCLYPGTVAISTTPDYEADDKYAVVEFDDGDSGRIALEDIRFLTCDYPVIEYDPNPLQSLGKRTKNKTNPEPTDVTADQTTVANCFSFQSEPNNHLQSREDKDKDKDNKAYKERRRLKKLRKDKLRQLATSDPNAKRHKHKHKCGDELCKHRKHKKRRKHKKHHHREGNTVFESAPTAEDDHPADEDAEMEEIKPVEIPVDKPKLTGKKNQIKGVNLQMNKLQWPLDDDLVSSVTEDSSGSSYNPKKTTKERTSSTSENHSKIAAFLPARQLWAWFGKGYKRNAGKGARNKKVFYKTIQRGKETISVGDSAVFLSTGRPDRPYIGRIESLWETSSNNRVVKVKWYYHPEETTHCPDLMYPGALFESPHEDENDVQTISHKCKVLPLSAYTKKYGPDPKKYSSVYDNNDTFYLAGYYDPTVLQLKMEKDIPTVGDTNTDANDNATNAKLIEM